MLGATTLAFLSARTVLNETRTTANDFRTQQAVEAASAAIDAGIARFSENNGQIDGSLTVPTAANIAALSASCSIATPPAFGATVNLSTNFGLYFYANDDATDPDFARCEANGENDAGTLWAVGWSDDCQAIRTISVCLGSVPLLKDGEGPKQPVVTGGSVGAFGNASIINRYTNISIWAGEDADVNGAAFATYLRPSNTEVEDYLDDTLEYEASPLWNNDPDVDAQLVSNRNSGFGIDVVTDDIGLLNSADGDAAEFWGMFFFNSKAVTKSELASSRVLDADELPPENDELSETYTENLYWVDGDTSMTGNLEYGSPDSPVILVVDGDFTLGGGSIVWGMVYVTGELTITGTPTVYGSVVSENGPNKGAGTLNVVYVPLGDENGFPKPPFPNSGVAIPGSWNDWNNPW